jgi:hypothetical protein
MAMVRRRIRWTLIAVAVLTGLATASVGSNLVPDLLRYAAFYYPIYLPVAVGMGCGERDVRFAARATATE